MINWRQSRNRSSTVRPGWKYSVMPAIIVATGREGGALREVRARGADTVINTAVPDDALAQVFTEARGEGHDVVLDFPWGRPTEILLGTLIPASFAFATPTRLVQAGESAGPALTITAASLRISGVEIYGAARGLDPAVMAQAYGQVVHWAQDGTLTFEAQTVPLSEIEDGWQRPAPRGRRLVVVP
jgi:NADPH:quinone reductase-like Zn-dependent oxidoreductase